MVSRRRGSSMDNVKWFQSKAEMARVLSKDRHTIDKWIAAPWFPAKDRRTGKWNRLRVLAAVEKHNREVVANTKPGTPRERKILLECDRLEVVIKRERELLKQEEIRTHELKKKVMPMSDVRNTCSELIAAFKGSLNVFISRVAADSKSAKWQGWAEQLRDDVLRDAAGRVKTRTS